eukprot:TRINITY_DN67371_c3_g4_i1.p1 TRINITY_DN67371_c3_g4~~TRINITY_DN67371_c3_g4_i1.p1  ORF type:complete len:194 (+),score=69.34 TRINITY_DN67371_c3_g4_i1:146-727(+)
MTRVSIETAAVYELARRQAIEAQLHSVKQRHDQQQQKLRLAQEEKELDEAAALDRKVREARTHIEENILTLRCANPNGCRLAFVDFDGCMALECFRCGGRLCGLCLKFCDNSEACHQHVLQCQFNPVRGELFATEEQFAAAVRRRQRFQLEQYLDALDKVVVQMVRQQMNLGEALRGESPRTQWTLFANLRPL